MERALHTSTQRSKTNSNGHVHIVAPINVDHASSDHASSDHATAKHGLDEEYQKAENKRVAIAEGSQAIPKHVSTIQAATGSVPSTPAGTLPTTTTSAATGASSVSMTDGWCESCSRHHQPRVINGKVEYDPVCPKEKGIVVPIFLHGKAGTNVGSRVPGHQRRGGGQLPKESARYCPVLMTDEFCTSQMCCFCFAPIELVPTKKLVNGVLKTVRCHGAIRCINPDCVSVKAGYGTRSRDANAATNIAIAGTSEAMGARLQPFNRHPNL